MCNEQFNRIYKHFIERTNEMETCCKEKSRRKPTETPKYEIQIMKSHTWRDKLTGKRPQYYARILSTWNGRIIFTSERYKNELDCMDISRRVRDNLIDSEISKTY